MSSLLDTIQQYTTLSVDSMFLDEALKYKPIVFENATSNQGIVYSWMLKTPSIINEAANLVVENKLSDPKDKDHFIQTVIYYTTALVGSKMVPNIHGHVLAQTLPSHAYDIEKTVESALGYINAYKDIGISKDRIIIKVPVTYETAQAARILKEKYGIKTLGTVVHSLQQAIIAAEAGCVAVSPYVDELKVALDPSKLVPYKSLEDSYGYVLTRDIHNYYHGHGIKTINVVAALIDIDTIKALIGCDEMTIPLVSLEKLKNLPAIKDFKPKLTKHVKSEDVPATRSYINDKDAYNKEISDNSIAVDRISFAIDTFMGFDKDARELVTKELTSSGIF